MLVPVPDMVGLNVQGELETWRAEELSRSILYSRRVMDEMRVAVVEGFNRVPHGGLEVGGILLGKRDGDSVCILAQKPVPCGYALGPSYVLTDEDQERFKKALEVAAANAGVTGMEPVGWYHSHTRSNIFLSERDLEIFNKFFPEPWHVALVLRPANLQPTAAGFFLREKDGSVRAEKSYGDFLVETPRRARPSERGREDGAAAAQDGFRTGTKLDPIPPLSDGAGNGRLSASASSEAPATHRAGVALGDLDPEDLEAGGGEAAVGVETSWAPDLLEDPDAGFSGLDSSFAERRAPWLASRFRWVLGAALAILIALGAWHWWGVRYNQLSLHALESGGHLRIEWDRHAPAILESRRGTLEIVDGVAKTVIALDSGQLRAGNVVYMRQSENVKVRLQVRPDSREPVEEVTHYIARLEPNTVPQPADESRRAELEHEADAMRTRLEKQNDELSRLQQMVTTMQTKPDAPDKAQGAKVESPAVQDAGSKESAERIVRNERDERASGAISNTATPRTGPAGAAQSTSTPAKTTATQQTAQAFTPPPARVPAKGSDAPVPSPPVIEQLVLPPSNPVASAPIQVPAPAPQTASHPPAGAPVATAPTPPKARPAMPSSGRLIWTGRLEKRGILTIDGKRASTGALNGELPGVPVRITVFPADLTAEGITLYSSNPKYAKGTVEPASPLNGWNKTSVKWEPAIANSLTMLEVPTTQNDWKRLVIQSDSPKVSMIILEWSAVR